MAIGAGLPRGARLAYRFVARDASAAANLGFSNTAFDTLRVGHDHVDGVWNPGPWTHANVRFNRRDVRAHNGVIASNGQAHDEIVQVVTRICEESGYNQDDGFW